MLQVVKNPIYWDIRNRYIFENMNYAARVSEMIRAFLRFSFIGFDYVCVGLVQPRAEHLINTSLNQDGNYKRRI